jgi:hypothetical protein
MYQLVGMQKGIRKKAGLEVINWLYSRFFWNVYCTNQLV